MSQPARDQDPVAVLSGIVRHADPSLDPDAVRAAVTSMAATARQRWNLVQALQERPGLLTSEGGQAPLRSVLRLIDALAPLGGDRIKQPACPGCGRTKPLQNRVNGLWSCRACTAGARAVPCVRCGAVRAPAARDADGGALCGRCRARDPQVMRICVGCQQLRPVAIRSPDGPRCESCRPRPILQCSVCGRTVPCRISTITGLPHCSTCRRRWARCSGCGQVRQLRSGTTSAPLCATCTQPQAGGWHPCPGCGEETVDGRGCLRCTLRRHLQGVLSDDTTRIHPGLQVLLEPLAGHERPISVLRWLRDSGTPILREMATGRLPLTHAALDDLPDSKLLAHLRAVLVSAGALPARDERMAQLEHWIVATISARPDPDERHLLHRYGTWYLARRLRGRSRGATSYHQVVAVRQRLRFAIAFLDALADRRLTLATATQPDLEAWLTSDAATGRHELGEFIRWASTNKLTALTLPSTTWAGPAAAVQAQERWDQARRLLHDQSLGPADRVAGLLVLLYAQRAASITRLTLDHLDLTPGAVRLRLGPEPVALPAPLDALVTTLAATSRKHRAIGDPGPSPWLFPGRRPGQPISAYQLGNRSKNLGIRPWQARNAALFDLAMDLPAALLARLLGINVDVAANWQRATAGDWTTYAADVARRREPVQGSVERHNQASPTEELTMTAPADATHIAEQLPSVLAARDRAGFERLLHPDVRWGGQEDTEQTCHDRRQAGDFYAALLEGGTRLDVLDSTVDDDGKILARLEVTAADGDPGLTYQTQILLTVRDGLVIGILQGEDDAPPTVELLFFADCPNHAVFLPHLQQLLDSYDISSPVQPIEVTDDKHAHQTRFLGSPSLRINGVDVEPGADSRNNYGLQCRIYDTPDGSSGTPSDAWILSALHAEHD